MNYIGRVLIFILIVSGCSEEVPLTFSSEVFTEEELEICATETCSSVTIQYVKATGEAAVSEKINNTISSYIAEALFLGDDDSPVSSTIPEAASHFIMAYRDYQPDFPSELDPGGYEAEINIVKTYQTEVIVCLETYKFLFTGGAHGYSGTQFLILDGHTGELLKPESLITDRSGLETVAETRFRELYEIPASESINTTGFWFENDQFHLPETIGFRDDMLVLLYNAYEISSYADGPVQLEIPLEEIESYLISELL